MRALPRLVASLALLGSVACEKGDPPAPFTPPDPGPLAPKDLTLASLNVYHGNPLALVGCDAATHCDAEARVALVGRHLEAAGCPDLATFQEVDVRMEDLLRDLAARICDGSYAVSILPRPALDIGIERQLLLTRLPVLFAQVLDVHAFPWVALHVRLYAEIGPAPGRTCRSRRRRAAGPSGRRTTPAWRSTCTAVASRTRAEGRPVPALSRPLAGALGARRPGAWAAGAGAWAPGWARGG